MNKKLSRLFWPGLWVYFAFMAGFSAAAFLMNNWVLAAVEAGVTLLLLAYYVVCRAHRRNAIQSYVKTAFGNDITISSCR